MDENVTRILKKRQGGIFIILVGVSIVMLVLSTKMLTGFPERVGLSAASFFQTTFHSVGEFFSQTVNSIVELKELKKNYASALDKLEEYENIERGYAEVRDENLRLKEQLGFSREILYQKVTAEIIAKDPGNVYSTMVINKGIKDGVKKNFPIIAYQNGIQGLVGRVVEVGRSTSIIIPLYDSTSYVACRLEKSRYEGLVAGQNSSEKPLLMQYVKKSSKDEIQFGDLVVTSGLKDLYPRDIAVGRVKAMKVEEFKTSMELELEPIIDFSRLEYVFIIYPHTEEER
jgi:rod shape-determining protein MreC